MQTQFTWKKGLFSDLFQIYNNDNQIGKLKDNSFSQVAKGEIQQKEYTFKSKGIMNYRTEIIDNSSSQIIGEIKYNNWMTKASIDIGESKALWQYDNFWSTKWSITQSDGIQIRFSGSSSKGEIQCNKVDELLILTGLYVINYHWQTTLVVIIAALIPIYLSLF
ncbi:MAG: hypothetical protein Q4G27_09225 [Flavobacteriaceae bacterium]|nr:hypothetical protein [Flavobacteriaceae bacterium]